MVYKPVGANESGRFPPRVEARLSKLEPFINMKSNGVIGNGVADDTAAIQAVFDSTSLFAANGVEFYFPAGRYKISATLRVKMHNPSIRGAGTGQKQASTQPGIGTRFELATGFVGTQAILVEQAGGGGGYPVYGSSLQDFTVDGAFVGTGITGVEIRSNRSFTEHVHVHRMSGHGLSLHGYKTTAGDPTNWDTYDSTFSFVQSGDNLGAGICFDSGSADGHMIGCILYNNLDNVLVKGASQQINSCHFYDATRNNIRFEGGGSRTKVTACKIEGSGEHGVYIDSTNGGYSDLQFTGNGFSTNGDLTHNTYDHVIITGPTTIGTGRTMFVGNSFGHKASQTPNIARYGINMSNVSAQNTFIVANSFGPASQFGTSQINNQGNTTTLPAFIRANSNVADNPPVLTVQDEGTALAVRPVVNFVGAGVTATDDGTGKTIVTIPGGGGAAAATPNFTPADHGYATWNFDPVFATQASSVGASGTAQVVKVRLTAPTTLYGFSISIAAIPGAPVTGNGGALYNSAKQLLGSSADTTTAWSTTGVKYTALTPASTGSMTNLPAGDYYVVFWMSWTTGTAPTVRGGANSSIVNAGLNTASSRHATADTGLVSTAPATLGTFIASNQSFWAALS